MPTFHPRAAIFGDQIPTNNNGTVRSKMASGRPYITVHYTGAPPNYGDFGDSPTEIRAIQAWAASAAKRTPWEYNYVFDTEGNVWEYAGDYQAAHSAGENAQAYGCLFLNGINDPATDRQVDAFRWFRSVLVAFGNVARFHEVRPHRHMPGASTSCPGNLIMQRWPEILTPWVEPEPDPPPPDPSEYKWIEPNCRFTLAPGDTPWGVARIAYGNGARYPELVTANPGAWTVGRQVVVPGVAGAAFKVRPGDGALAILRDIWPMDDPYRRLATFNRWNGTDLKAGDVAYAPVDPMP